MHKEIFVPRFIRPHLHKLNYSSKRTYRNMIFIPQFIHPRSLSVIFPPLRWTIKFATINKFLNKTIRYDVQPTVSNPAIKVTLIQLQLGWWADGNDNISISRLWRT